MAQPAPLHLQGADPALIAILNRMENKDSTCKKFLMFPKADFNGTSKQAAESLVKFSKVCSISKQSKSFGS